MHTWGTVASNLSLQDVGKLTDGAPMYRVAPHKSPEETVAEMEAHRAAGYGQFQIKVGADWATDIDRIQATVPLLNVREIDPPMKQMGGLVIFRGARNRCIAWPSLHTGL